MLPVRSGGINPLISPHCDHCRATRTLHEARLKAVREVTGKEVGFVLRDTTGPVRPPTAE